MGAALTRLTVMSVGSVPEAKAMLLKGLPKLSAGPPLVNPKRFTLPITSAAPVEVPLAGIVRMFAPVVRLFVRVSMPFAVAF